METRKITITTQSFTESANALDNPNLGFYRLYIFSITDEETDYAAQTAEYSQWDPDTSLALVEINLKEYREGRISQAGLDNIEALFHAWAQSGKRLIVRFLYDAAGENLDTEPESLDIILGHMEQVGPALRQYADTIFTLQGLFVGNWGEMNSTKYGSEEDLRQLAKTLARVSGNLYLAVRTPAQWRVITRQGKEGQLAARLGLFNDGMLGSASDLGTYDMTAQGDERRTRAGELDFQSELCAKVPNGGEVICGGAYSDFENAAADLAAMHVTYLNQDYDQDVYDKWAAVTVSEKGCFDGLDGLSYIQRHLGYRLLITQAKVSRTVFGRQVDVTASFRNEGFAPLYEPAEMTFTLRRDGAENAQSFPVEHSLQELSGGRGSEKIETVQTSFSTGGLTEGVYRLYLSLTDSVTGRPVLLANEQEPETDGYFLGAIEIQK